MSKKRSVIVALVAAAIGGGLIFFRSTLQRRTFAYVVVRQPAPSEEALDDLMKQSEQAPVNALVALWKSDHLISRHYAINYLRQHPEICQSHWDTFKPMALASALSGDVDLQEPGVAVLVRRDPTLAAGVVSRLLDDPDPDTRLTAIRAATEAKDARFASRLASLAADPEKPVRVMIPGSLLSITGHALDDRYRDETLRVAAIADWQAWWGTQRGGAQASTDAAPLPLAAPAGPEAAPDFELTDLSGQKMRLSDYKGKVVLLNFWATTCGPCVAELPDLQNLQQRHLTDLAVIGVSADAVPDDDSPPRTEDLSPKVLKVLHEKQVTYRVAIDRRGRAVGAYDGSGIPMTALIDRQGRLRRRLLGARSADAWEKLIASVRDESN